MTTEAQRIAIAQFRGHRFTYGKRWAEDDCELTYLVSPEGGEIASAVRGDESWWQWAHLLPDYHNDLNVALPLLSAITPLGWGIQNSYNGETGCWVIISDPSKPSASNCCDAIVVNGETFCAAICKAFLKHVGGWVE